MALLYDTKVSSNYPAYGMQISAPGSAGFFEPDPEKMYPLDGTWWLELTPKSAAHFKKSGAEVVERELPEYPDE
jgi:hypothetical protein